MNLYLELYRCIKLFIYDKTLKKKFNLKMIINDSNKSKINHNTQFIGAGWHGCDFLVRSKRTRQSDETGF